MPPFSFFDFVVLFAHISLYIANAIRLFSQNMKIQRMRFNIYLCLLTAALGLVCRAAEPAAAKTEVDPKAKAAAEARRKAEEKKHRKEASTIRFHLETTSFGGERSQEISVLRSQPMKLWVERDPFINEGNVVHASLEEQSEAFSIKLQLDRRGIWMLENITASNPGKRLAIFSQFGEARWIAAPLIKHRIGKGEITFTPDASHAEVERIVRGLNNVAAKVQKQEKDKF